MPVYASIQVTCTRCTRPFLVTGKKAKERARLHRFCAACKKLNDNESHFRYRMRTFKRRPQKARKARHLIDMDPGISTARLLDIIIKES